MGRFPFCLLTKRKELLSPIAPPEPSIILDHALSLLGKALPSSGSEVGAWVDAVSTSGPGKPFFPSFTTKGKEMPGMILV